MNFKNLYESTEIYTPDYKRVKLQKNISKHSKLHIVLAVAKKCILSGNDYCILSDYEYNVNQIVSNFIKSFDGEYNLRKDPSLLEYRLIPYSSYLIFHVADMKTGDIEVNPHCEYSCYLYLPTEQSRAQAVIVLKNNDDLIENLQNVIQRIFSEVYETKQYDFDKNNLADVLKLCADSLKALPSVQKSPFDQALSNSIKQSLMFNNYTINYSEKALEKMYNDGAKNAALEAIKNYRKSSVLIQGKCENSTLYSDMENLISVTAAENMTVILGYYFYSLFYFGNNEEPKRYFISDQVSLEAGKPPILNVVYSKTDEILPLFKRLNKIFFGKKCCLYEYPDDKEDEFVLIPSSLVCVHCKKASEKLCSKKWFKKMAEDNTTVVVSTTPIEGSKLKIQKIKIKKIISLSALTKNKRYGALKTAISNFRKHIYNNSKSYSDVIKEQGKKSNIYSYVKKLFQAYREEASDKTTYCEDKHLAKIFFYVYSFLKYCISENLLTIEQANKLNRKLFSNYFKNDLMLFSGEVAADKEPVSEEEIADVIMKILRIKYESIPSSDGKNVLPCKFDTYHYGECILFPQKNFLNEFAGWLERDFPEETPSIELIKRYGSQSEEANSNIRQFLNEKDFLGVTSGKDFYKRDNFYYVAFRSDKVKGE